MERGTFSAAAGFGRDLLLRESPPVEFFIIGNEMEPAMRAMLNVPFERYIPHARTKIYAQRKGGYRRGALIFPYFLKPVGYVAIKGRLYGAFEHPEDLRAILKEHGY